MAPIWSCLSCFVFRVADFLFLLFFFICPSLLLFFSSFYFLLSLFFLFCLPGFLMGGGVDAMEYMGGMGVLLNGGRRIYDK
ncbi:hypothetical protein [Granulicella sp. dw_53]|uniref:hypothetical protein n=1 Tax=Granulicella sp. dw_53 TaxID=2719792 RepID=UPI001BD6ADD2|nr:hypothetical protein [Granulicella sp. dw_53]